MKIRIYDYVFNKTAKTITFVDYATIDVTGILLITNITDNIIVFNFADPALGGTVTNNVLTLTYDTSSMSDTDKLQIWYEDGIVLGVDLAEKVQDESIPLLRRIVKLLEVSGNADIANRQRVAVEALPTLAAVTTVTTVSNLGTIASYDQRQWQDTARIAYNTGIRDKLIFT